MDARNMTCSYSTRNKVNVHENISTYNVVISHLVDTRRIPTYPAIVSFYTLLYLSLFLSLPLSNNILYLKIP